MAFGVFIHRSDSIYDDSPAERYQFPANYLSRAQKFIDDWIVYYEPSKVKNTRGYFAIAKVEKIIPDPTAQNMYLALIEPGSYMDFVNPVSFKDEDGLVERGLLNEQGKISGRAQSAVRPVSPKDFGRIIERGFDEQELDLPRFDEQQEDQPGSLELPGMAEGQTPFIFDQPRTIEEQTIKRKVRDRLFRSVVVKAYDKRCAITGLQLINGGGRAEVEAAHIKPVKDNGPDIISNGIALSGTVHWMFDRGLIGLRDDYEILISRHVNDPSSIQSLINKTGKAIVPPRQSDRPHPTFLAWHRDNCFKA
ncbi:HNH endonuclease [Cohaesibacter gelatinilyticus]|uniref:Putative restriction endonuclease n=1 Tax=Cohaesibacter gelatinilyticus TaxID=372072 RepID=A0A285PDV9_9HYPH|nr:HNH endonuclease [Cohaesibacter gelatinilyticus]SNZ19433.1 putative restriction endonuclease [Cohaesibacter gelatinilyticus]